ncbi:unannotated protein [freshwater metagenome]|uniref:Unannotated protein n=1 Tax=freshwater metagenome TaxID=449393 RepID=A0A6J7GDQ0_9ZZZZ
MQLLTLVVFSALTYGNFMRRIRVLAVGIMLIVSLLPVASGAMAIDVGSNDATDQFVGSGEDLGQRQGSEGSQSEQACAHCQWMLGDPCSSLYNDIGCGTVTEGCPSGQEQRRRWFSTDDGHTWQDRGLTCVGGAATAIDPGGVQLLSAFERSVPQGLITWQPTVGVLPQVPVLFDSGQPPALAPSQHGLGAALVELSPWASWHWDFGDGGSLDTQIAGSRFPETQVAHTYRRGGRFRVTLTTVWTATYTVNGAGPYAVDGQITQEAQRWLVVGQGRAVLTPGE